MSELTVLTPTELESALSEFLTHFENDYFSEAALTSLQKTFQTHNITIQDWNTVIEYLKQNVKNTTKVKDLISELSKYIIKDNSIYITTNKEGTELPAISKDKYLIQGDNVIYPFTKQENVIGLQKTITDKLPIVSEQQPQNGFVEKQVWLDVSEGASEEVSITPELSNIVESPLGFYIQEDEPLLFEEQPEEIYFDNFEDDDNILFEGEHI